MRILTIGMGNLNRRRAIGAARAAVRDESRLFVAGRAAEVHCRRLAYAGTSERPLCFPCVARMEPPGLAFGKSEDRLRAAVATSATKWTV